MPVEPLAFRRALGAFATGVAVVTYRDEGRPAGLTVNAFSSVSLCPPLVLVCIDQGAESHDPLLAAGAFGVNLLRAGQDGMSRRFAAKDVPLLDRFEGLDWRPGSVLGVPLIDDCLGFLECRTVARHPTGDHTIFVGEVVDLGADEGQPLLFFRGRYGRLSPLDPAAPA